MKALDDKQLMQRYIQGEALAFEELYLRHKSTVYTYLVKRVHQKNYIDELHQEVFMKFHKSRNLYNPKYEFLPWLYTITKTCFLDYCKKKKIEFVELTENLEPSLPPQGTADAKALDLNTVSTLSDKEKQAVNLRYFDEQEFKEISALLNTSEANARKLVSRGVKKLKNFFKGDGHE